MRCVFTTSAQTFQLNPEETQINHFIAFVSRTVFLWTCQPSIPVCFEATKSCKFFPFATHSSIFNWNTNLSITLNQFLLKLMRKYCRNWCLWTDPDKYLNVLLSSPSFPGCLSLIFSFYSFKLPPFQIIPFLFFFIHF